MGEKIKDIALRLKEMREISDISIEDMAANTDVTYEEYLLRESGEADLSISFLEKCARYLDMDVVELLSGMPPKLKSYSVVRKGTGLLVTRREGFVSEHLAYKFIGRKAEPYSVIAPFDPDEQDIMPHLNSHDGHEFDYILSGSLRIVVDGTEKILLPGDSMYYDSSKPHGMVAVGGEDCHFLAILME